MVGDASHNQLSSPFCMDRVTTVLQFIEAFIGLPLNVMMAAIIISWRRLHSPRNILWLGSAFSNLFILITINIIKFYAFHWQDVPSCKLYVFLVGIPYASLLMNLLLALIDRSICVIVVVQTESEDILDCTRSAELFSIDLLHCKEPLHIRIALTSVHFQSKRGSNRYINYARFIHPVHRRPGNSVLACQILLKCERLQ